MECNSRAANHQSSFLRNCSPTSPGSEASRLACGSTGGTRMSDDRQIRTETNRRSSWRLCQALLILLLTQRSQSNWWYLGLSSSVYQSTDSSTKVNYKDKCSELDVLEDHQKEMCSKARNILAVVSRGASMAIEECQFQFQRRRWNCTTFDQKTVFGNVVSRNSREKAYIYAISSAGIMHAVARACAKGDVQMCSCDLGIRNEKPGEDFVWGGCSHDIKFGEKFAKDFAEAKEANSVSENLMNNWNNEAGRKAVSRNLKLLCKCHGVSGSCSSKICWRTVAPFREVGDHLRDKFDGAIRVSIHPRRMKLRPIDRKQKRPTRSDLIYIEQSPDYCDHKPEVGSLGTSGRQCNRTSYGLDGCQLMCCGRGYRTYMETEAEDCDCRFFWCCRVECQTCVRRVEKYYCN